MSIDDLFELVAKENASDLLLSAGAPPVLRVDGDLLRTRGDALTPEMCKELIYGFLTKEQQDVFERDKELDFSLAHGRRHRYRVNVYYQRQAVTAALRPIPERIPPLDELGLPECVGELANARQGMVLVTGPTGHGKTTTLAALVDRINDERACHIITIEDPIEYVHHHRRSIVDQREVGADTHGFNKALRCVLRQDPDVILVGEMRDLETIAAAITAAETGHLVLSTLHTAGAALTVDRIVDVFPSEQQQQVRVQVANIIEGVLSQTLLPTVDGRGRVAAVEVMTASPAIRSLIRDGKSHQLPGVIETSQRLGMQTLDQALVALCRQGRVTVEEALTRAGNAEHMRALLSY